jgi:hypothetical protein
MKFGVANAALTNWVEVGFVDNNGYASYVRSGVEAFWEDTRPADAGGLPPFHIHVLTINPNYLSTLVQVHLGTTNTFALQAGTATGQSTSNSMPIDFAQVVSEISSNISKGYSSFAHISWWHRPSWILGTPGAPRVHVETDSPAAWTWSPPYTDGYGGASC